MANVQALRNELSSTTIGGSGAVPVRVGSLLALVSCAHSVWLRLGLRVSCSPLSTLLLVGRPSIVRPHLLLLLQVVTVLLLVHRTMPLLLLLLPLLHLMLLDR